MYGITFDGSVVEHDLPKLSSGIRKRIVLVIERKLGTHPDLYGAPLRQSLAGYRKLRVGDYRVIYAIRAKTVKVFMIANRSSVYAAILKRLGIK